MGLPQLRWGTNMLFKRTEHTEHSLIDEKEEKDNDDGIR
jgi:hypothetical protein